MKPFALAPWVEAKVLASQRLTELGMFRRARQVMIADARPSVLAELMAAKTSLLDYWDILQTQHPTPEDCAAMLDAISTVAAAIAACTESSIVDALTRESTCPPPCDPTMRPGA